jgi:hypothetical protein
MRARTFLVGIVAAVLVVTLANAAWADRGGRGSYPPPAAPAAYRWYGHPYHHPGYRYYYAPRPAYMPPPHQGLGMVEDTWVAASGYRYPVWGFRFRFTGTNRADSLRRARHANSFWGKGCEPAIRMGRRLIPGEQAITRRSVPIWFDSCKTAPGE